MADFHGAFVFRNQAHGILSSTYFNTPLPTPYPEAAILKGQADENDPFLGEFETIWLEEHDHYRVKLKITKNKTYDKAYDLKWMKDIKGNNIEWEGLGNLEIVRIRSWKII